MLPLELYSVERAAQALSLSPWTIRAHIKLKTIRGTHCGRRTLISRTEIERIAQEGLPSLTQREEATTP